MLLFNETFYSVEAICNAILFVWLFGKVKRTLASGKGIVNELLSWKKCQASSKHFASLMLLSGLGFGFIGNSLAAVLRASTGYIQIGSGAVFGLAPNDILIQQAGSVGVALLKVLLLVGEVFRLFGFWLFFQMLQSVVLLVLGTLEESRIFAATLVAAGTCAIPCFVFFLAEMNVRLQGVFVSLAFGVWTIWNAVEIGKLKTKYFAILKLQQIEADGADRSRVHRVPPSRLREQMADANFVLFCILPGWVANSIVFSYVGEWGHPFWGAIFRSVSQVLGSLSVVIMINLCFPTEAVLYQAKHR